MRRSAHANRMARRQARTKQQPKLNLVSLMDIFTILVFFLLVNSSEVEVLQTNKSIELPESIAEKKPENTLIVTVSKNDIIINGRRVAAVDDISSSDDELIAPLQKELEYLASRNPFDSPEEAAQGRDITIMGDASIPYTLLKKVMNTSAESGYANVSLAVTQIQAEEPDTAAGG